MTSRPAVATDSRWPWLAVVRVELPPVPRVLVTEEIADGGLDRLRAAGHDVDVQLDLTPSELLDADRRAPTR